MPTSSAPPNVHVALDQPIRAFVEECILYGMDERRTKLRACQIIGLSSYKDFALTAQILVKEGNTYSTIWSDVPLHMLFHKAGRPRPSDRLDLKDVVYHNNPDEYITLTTYPTLARGSCECFFSLKDRWLSGTYLATIDWYKGNHCAHLVALDNGQFALMPNHKIQFNNGPRELQHYQKQCVEWKVDS